MLLPELLIIRSCTLNSLLLCLKLIILIFRYQMLYEMELKGFSGPNIAVYPRWHCCLLWLSFAYICFATQLLNRNHLALEGDVYLYFSYKVCISYFYMFLLSFTNILIQVNFCVHHCSCIPSRCSLFWYCRICRNVGVSPCQC